MLLSPTQPSGANSYCWWLQQLCTALTVLALGRTSAMGVPPVSTAMAPPTGISLIVVSFSMDKGPTLLHSTEKRSVNRQAGSLPDQGRPCRRWTATRRLSTRSSDRRWWRVCRDRSPRARGHVVERWGATVSSTTRSPSAWTPCVRGGMIVQWPAVSSMVSSPAVSTPLPEITCRVAGPGATWSWRSRPEAVPSGSVYVARLLGGQ